jgi:hypothetical protein
MFSSSSTSNSDAELALAGSLRRFRLRLVGFFAPIALIGFIVAGVALRSGELLPVDFIAWLQTFGKPFVFLTQFSDHTYALKLDAARRRKPEILVLGSSRANQWRSAMFRPYTFYNAGNAIFAIGDFYRALEQLEDYHPRVIIFSIDYFTFVPAFDSVYKSQSRVEVGGWGSAERSFILRSMFQEAARNPFGLLRGPGDVVPALGLSAIKTGTGARLDGSYQYGQVIHGPPQVDAEGAAAGILTGKQWPTPAASRLDETLLHEFERFTELARQKNIALVGVTMPFVPAVLTAFEQSPLYDGWRQFESQQMREWIQKQGVIYFDFTRLQDFGGKPDEFVDPFHPAETAYLRVLLAMLDDVRFGALFPNIELGVLRDRLKQATPFEVYRNEF